jgi:threonine dehydrogenase-like Zn-dependent dehydrogenase
VQRTRESGAEVTGLLKAGSAYVSPGSAIARQVEAIARGSDEVVPACVASGGAYGLRDVRIGLLVRLGPHGVREIVELELRPAELQALAHLVVEAVGQIATLDAAIALVRKRGRIVSVAAHAAQSWAFPVAQAFARELSVRFAIGDSIRYRNRLFTMIAGGILDPHDIIEERVSFADAPLAYEHMASGQIPKAVIDPRL